MSACELVLKEDRLSIYFNSSNAYVVLHMLFINFRNIKQVLCSRISPILFFYISQDSAATHLRRDGQCGMGFVANFLENTTVKKFRKLANICQSYE